ncbi:MAG: hypothetical protein L3J33_10445 [Rhodobacteraceae bacterium]|nr:hypothetical protein [Paracoccaceae bacterium]
MPESGPFGRVAVLISGQVRSDDEDIKKIAIACEQVNADVFISVWRKRGMKGFGGGQGLLQLARIFGSRTAIVMPRNWIGANMRKVFPQSEHILPDFGDIQKQQLLEIFPNAQIEVTEEQPDLTIPYMDSNSLRMLFMIHSCNVLKRESETRGNFRYDIVARHRPDVKMNYNRAFGFFSKHKKLVLPNSDVKNTGQLHDVFWVGSSEDDDTLSKLYFRAEETREQGWGGIHVELCNWVDGNKIPYDMFNCLSAGINDASYNNNDTQLTTSKNLLAAIQNRQLDIEAASGDIFCTTFAEVFDGVLTGKFATPAGIAEKIDHVSELKIRPKFKLFLFQAFCWLTCFDKTKNLNDRLAAFLAALWIDQITRNDNALNWSATAFGQVFGQEVTKQQILDILLGDLPALFVRSEFAQKILQSIHRFSETPDQQKEQQLALIANNIVFKHQNWKWFATGLEAEGAYRAIVNMCELQLSSGEYTRGLINYGIKACSFTGDQNALEKLLLGAAKADQSAQTFSGLGQFYFRAGNNPAAKQAFLKAAAFGGHGNQIDDMLLKLKDY